MSERGINRPTEDVLSSIRRLVSSDAQADRDAVRGETSDKLVLTPAQRVERDATTPEDSSPSQDLDLSKPMLLTRPVIETDQADGQGPHAPEAAEAEARPTLDVSFAEKALLDMVESELSQAMAARSRTWTKADSTSGLTAAATPEKTSASQANPALGVRPGRAARGSHAGLTLEQKVAELERLISERRGQDRVEDNNTTPDLSKAMVRDGDEDPRVDELIWTDGALTSKKIEPEQTDTSADHAERDMPDRGPSVAEPEAPFAIAVKESKSADADSPETPTDAQIGESVDPHGQTRQMMDKDMLRGLVAELVRQELKGALGEHITLKLQKLVRREIHRTLTAQIFD